MNYHKQRAQKSRDALLAAAEEEFLANGYTDTSIDVILKTSGISRQTLFSHFGSKENLFLEVCNNMFLRELPELRHTPDYFSGLVDFLRLFAVVALKENNVGSLRLSIIESKKFPDVAASRYRKGSQKVIALVRAYLEEGISKGLIREANSAVLTEQLLMSTLGYRQYRALLGVHEEQISTEDYLQSALLGIVTSAGKARLKKILGG